jgi:hypothetical protein
MKRRVASGLMGKVSRSRVYLCLQRNREEGILEDGSLGGVGDGCEGCDVEVDE